LFGLFLNILVSIEFYDLIIKIVEYFSYLVTILFIIDVLIMHNFYD